MHRKIKQHLMVVEVLAGYGIKPGLKLRHERPHGMGKAIVLEGLGSQEAHLAIALGHQMAHLRRRDRDGLPGGGALLSDNGVGVGQTLPPELAQTSMQSLREQSTAYEHYYRQLQSFVAQRKQAQRPQRPSPIYVVSPLCQLPAYEEMYERYFRRNAFLAGHKHIHLEPIYTEPFAGYLSRTYNSFLELYNYSRPAWLVFVHGDYEITCDLSALLAHEAKDQLLGPSGAVIKEINGQPLSVFACFCDSQRRDGAFYQGGPCNLQVMGDARELDTFDSCCLVVHSSLVQRYHLRFDEAIALDFIVEDFCANARLNHGIKCKLIELWGIHHTNSTGMPDTQNQRFYDTQAYIAAKYPHACLGGTCSFISGAAPHVHAP